jgi:hypothetical protein
MYKGVNFQGCKVINDYVFYHKFRGCKIKNKKHILVMNNNSETSVKVDEISKKILIKSGILLNSYENPEELLILRETLLNDALYKEFENDILELKKILSSTALTSLQKDATKNQKWPLLNLVRQILNVYGYKMTPIRKSDGYAVGGVKKFKRYFRIDKK